MYLLLNRAQIDIFHMVWVEWKDEIRENVNAWWIGLIRYDVSQNRLSVPPDHRQWPTAPKRHGFLPESRGHSLRLLGAAHGGLKPDVWQQQGERDGNVGSQQTVAGPDSQRRRALSLSVTSVTKPGKESQRPPLSASTVTDVVTHSQVRSGYDGLSGHSATLKECICSCANVVLIGI